MYLHPKVGNTMNIKILDKKEEKKNSATWDTTVLPNDYLNIYAPFKC